MGLRLEARFFAVSPLWLGALNCISRLWYRFAKARWRGRFILRVYVITEK